MKSRFSVFAILFSVVLLASSCREKIDGGNEGVLVDQYGSGKGQGVSLVAGSTWYNPWTQDVYQFPLFIQNADYEEFAVSSKGGPIFTIAPRVAYKIQKGKAPDIFRKYRKDVEEIQDAALNTYTRDAFRVIYGKFTPDQIVTNRDTVETLINNYLAKVLDADGFHLEQLTYSMTLPKSIQQSIDAQAREVAKTKEAESRLKTAEVNARETILIAEAQAKANKLKEQTLTPLLIQQQFIEKWNGAVPLYGTAPVMFKNVN